MFGRPWMRMLMLLLSDSIDSRGLVTRELIIPSDEQGTTSDSSLNRRALDTVGMFLLMMMACPRQINLVAFTNARM